MKIFSILFVLLLTSCNSIVKHKEDFKLIGHDMVDEGIDDAVDELHPEQPKQ